MECLWLSSSPFFLIWIQIWIFTSWVQNPIPTWESVVKSDWLLLVPTESRPDITFLVYFSRGEQSLQWVYFVSVTHILPLTDTSKVPTSSFFRNSESQTVQHQSVLINEEKFVPVKNPNLTFLMIYTDTPNWWLKSPVSGFISGSS